MSLDHLQMPATAGLISNRVGMTALLHILLCFEFVPPPNLLFFTFVFVLPRPPPFFAGYELPSSIFFFFGQKIFVGHLVRQTGVFCRTLWKNVRLSDKSDEFRHHCHVRCLLGFNYIYATWITRTAQGQLFLCGTDKLIVARITHWIVILLPW